MLIRSKIKVHMYILLLFSREHMSLRCTTTHLSYNFYLKPAIYYYYHKFKWVAFLQVEQNYVEYYCFKLVGSFLLDTDPRLK